MTLNDLERRNGPYFAFFHGILQIFRPIISQWLKYTVRKILSPSSSLLLLAKTITHPAARSLCDSWASCWMFQEVKYDYTINLACTRDRSEYDIESYWKVV